MEKVLIVVAVIAAMANGAALPVFTLFFKDLIDGGFGGAGALNIKTVEDTALKFLYLSIALFFVGFSTFVPQCTPTHIIPYVTPPHSCPLNPHSALKHIDRAVPLLDTHAPK